MILSIGWLKSFESLSEEWYALKYQSYWLSK